MKNSAEHPPRPLPTPARADCAHAGPDDDTIPGAPFSPITLATQMMNWTRRMGCILFSTLNLCDVFSIY